MTTSPYDDVLFTELYPYLEPELIKCPRPLILQTIRNIVADFFRLTQVWRYDVPEINLIQNQIDYTITDIPDCAVVDVINELRVWWTQANKNNTDDKGTVLDPIYGYTMVDKETFRLCQKPAEDVTNGLFVNAILRPRRDADAMPGRIFEDYYQTICYGILTRLMVQKNKAWTNLESASMYSQMYQNGIGVARVQINRGLMNAKLVGVPRFNWC